MKEQAIRFDVLKRWRFWMSFSGALTLAGIIAMVWNSMTIGFPLNRGVDFTGGTLLQLKYPSAVSQKELFDIVSKQVTKEPVVQTGPAEGGGTRVMIRTEQGQAVRDKVLAAVTAAKPGFEIEDEKNVAPAFGAELAMWGAIALIIAWALILIYIAFRYKFSFGVGAVASLIHDAIMVLGIYALFRIEVNTPFIASLLSVLGYSVSDTVIVSDRIRENMKLYRGANLVNLSNLSINQTLRRTLLTSLSTLIPVFAMFFFGGPTLKTFVLAMAIGFTSGVYSTWFIAIPVMLLIEGALAFVKRTPAEESRVAPVASATAATPAAGTSGGSQSTSANGPSGESADYRRKKKKARRR